MLYRIWYGACFICYISHDTWQNGTQTVYLLVCDWSVPYVLFTVTSCGIATLIWRGILKQADRAGPQEILLLCSEAWRCAATTVDFLVLSECAHRTRNIFKLRFMCQLMIVSHRQCINMNWGRERERGRENVSVCVCVTCCLNSTYSTTGGCVCTFSVFANFLLSRSLTYMANVSV